MTKIQITIETCKDCPLVKTKPTSGSGFATDYWCSVTVPEKIIVGYVEWDDEIPEVPEWCPIRVRD